MALNTKFNAKNGISVGIPSVSLIDNVGNAIFPTVSARQYLGLQPSLSGLAALVGGNSLGSALTIGTNDNYDLNLETAGSTKMIVTSAGNVGIGTITPSSLLNIYGTGPKITLEGTTNSSPGVLFKNSAGTMSLETNSVRDFAVQDNTAGTSRFIIRSNGTIGVGDYYGPSNYPQNKLSVNGSASIGYATNADTAAPSNGLIVSGNVGIGTTTSTEKLTVVGVISSTNVIYASGGNSNAWNSAYTSVNTISANGASAYTTVNANSANWSNAYTSVNAISANGASNYTTVNTNSANWSNAYTTTNTNSAGWTSVYTTTNTNSANYILAGGNSKGADIVIGTNDNFALNLETAGSTKVSITSGGLVGIGVTAPSSILDINDSNGSQKNVVLSLRNGNYGWWTMTSSNSNTSGFLRFASNNSGQTPLTLDGTTGSVGISNSTPAARLDIADTTLAGSGSLAGSILNLAQTWNTTGAPTAIKLNVTNTASGAASNLLDLQIGSISRFKITKDGAIDFGPSNTASQRSVINSGLGQLTIFARGDVPTQAYSAGGLYNGVLGGLFLGSGFGLQWSAGSFADGGGYDLYLSRRGAANLRLGTVDVAAPVAQTLSVQSVVAGTTNLSGSNFTITGSQGTGTGAGGSIIFQTAPAGSSGTNQNGLSAALTIDSSLNTYSASNFIVPNVGAKGFWVTGSPTHSGMVNGGGLATLDFKCNAETVLSLVNNGSQRRTQLHVSGELGFSSDITLIRDAANTLAMRNGISPQTFRLYNTYSNSTTYERADIKWDSTALKIGTDKGSAGGAATPIHFYTDSISRMIISSTGLVTVRDEAGTQQQVINNYTSLNNSYSDGSPNALPWILDAATNNILHNYTTRLTVTDTGTTAASGVFTRLIEWPSSELSDPVYGMVYAQGAVILKCYSGLNALSVRVRFWNTNSGAWSSWASASNITRDTNWGIWRADIGGNYMTKLEVETTSPPGNSTSITGIEYYPTRSNYGIRYPHLFAAQGADKLLFGGGKSTHAAIVGSGNTLKIRRGDDSADGSITAAAATFSTTLSVAGTSSLADVNIGSTNLIRVGGTANTFTALRNSSFGSSRLAVRLADDSAYGMLGASGFEVFNGNNRAVQFSLNMGGSIGGVGFDSQMRIVWASTNSSSVDTNIGASADTGITRISAGLIGIGTSGAGSFAGSIKATNAEFVGSVTAVGAISSTNVVYASGGNSNLWNSAYSSVNTISANGATTFTTVNTNSSNWSNAYTTTNANSANWSSVYSTTNANSANWSSVYTTSNANSASWSSVYSSYNAASATILKGTISSTGQGNITIPRVGGGNESVTISELGTSGNPTFNNLTVSGNLSVVGDFTYLNTGVSVTSALSVVNTGTGPALLVRQSGTTPIAHFIDADGTGDIVFANNGFVGIGTTSPTNLLHLNSVAGTGAAQLLVQNDTDTAVPVLQFLRRRPAGAAIVSGDSLGRISASGSKSSTVNLGAGYIEFQANGSPAGFNNVLPSKINFVTYVNDAYATYTNSLIAGAFVAGGTTGQFIFNKNDNIGGDYAPDTGISRLSAGVIGIGNATAGTSGGTLIAGSIGIGTTNPGYLLDLNGNGRVTNTLYFGTSSLASMGMVGPNLTINSYAGNPVKIDTLQVTSFQFGVTFQYGDLTLNKAAGTDTYIRSTNQDLRLQSGSTYNLLLNPTAGSVGIGTTAPNEKLTVSGNISSSNVVYASGGNSNLWNSAYTSVNTISANGATTYTTVNANSAAWSSVYSTTNANSANWSSSYATATAVSAIGASTYSTVNANSANWNSTYTTVNTNSANYILAGGNSKGADIVIGTNDNFALNLETAGSTKVSITSGGLVGVGTTSTPVTRLQVNNKVIDAAGYVYDTDTLLVTHQTPTATATLNDPKTVLVLARQGTSGQAFGAAAAFNLSRFENSSTNSRTRLDISMANGSYDLVGTNVLTLLSNGNVGIGTTAPNEKLTVSGNISSSNIVYALGGNSSLWNSAYTSVNTISANGATTYTTVNSNSAAWSSVYTTTNANSANWNSAYNTVNTNSTKWDSTYTTTNANSANWSSVYTTTGANSAKWNSDYTTVNTNSASWSSVYTTTNTNSANWGNAYTVTSTNSAKWDSAYTSVNTISANGASTYTTVNTNSANYILAGGNSKGAHILIGTNDSYDLRFETNGIERAKITAAGLFSAEGVTISRGGGSQTTNTAIGNALVSNTFGTRCVSIGDTSLYNNTNGIYNTAIGYASLLSNTSGNYNVAIGAESLISNISGSDNMAVGLGALYENRTGDRNTAIGYNSIAATLTGSDNIGIGYQAGTGPDFDVTDINNSVFIGNDTIPYNTVGNTNSVVIGNTAVGMGSNTVVIGNNSITNTYLKGAVQVHRSNADPVNYERLTMRWNGLVGTIGTSKLGTGVARSLALETNNSTQMSITSGGNVGMGTIDPVEKLTVVGNISSSNIIYAIGGNSNAWNSAYTSVNTISANGASTYTTVNSNSAAWSSVYTTTNANSANWVSVYTTTNTNSANWTSAYNTVNTNSSKWDSAYTTTNANSANWSSSYTVVTAVSAIGASTYSTVNANSANWSSVYTTTGTNSAKWDSAYTTTNANSANYILDGGNTKGVALIVGTNDNFNLNLETAGTTKMTVTSAGNIGIGTTTPISKLEIVDTTSAINLSGAALQIYHTWNAPGVDVTAIKLNVSSSASGANSKLIDLQIGGTSYFNVDKAGATTMASAVFVTGGNSNLWNSNYTTTNTNSAKWNSDYTTVNTNSAAWSSVYSTVNTNSASYIVNGGNTLGGTITIGTNDANNFNLETSGTARVSISSTGQVGIGTTTPDADLVVYKNVVASPTTFKIRTATGTGSRLDFYRTDAYVATRFDVLSTNDFQFYNNNDVATPKYIINGTNGNFGIGTTSTAQKVTIGGSLSASGSLYGERAILGDTAASVYLERDAINALGIRNSTAAQTLNVYGTYTSSTNFERLTLAASSLGGVIGHYAGGGGGVARDLLFQTSNTTRMTIAAAGSVNVAGHFSAATKSFLIDHPTQEGKKLQYGVVESNQHSVLVRGKTSESIIELPEEWSGLVHEDSVTVQLTPIGSYQQLYVVSQDNQRVVVGGSTGKYNYTIYGERKDVSKLQTVV